MWPPVYRSLFFVALISITTLAVLPQAEVPLSTGWDKSNHLLAFFVLSLLLHRAQGVSTWKLQVGLLLLYGLLIEVVQWMLPDRYFSWLDVFADGLGVALYWLVHWLVCPVLDRAEQWFERLLKGQGT